MVSTSAIILCMAMEFQSSAAGVDNEVDSKASPVDKILPLSELRDGARSELLAVIDSLRGLKCLVVQSELGGLLNQIMTEGSKSLKDIGVQ